MPPEPPHPYASYGLEVFILDVAEKTSKSGNTYYSLRVKDDKGVIRYVMVFEDDMMRNREDLKAGSYVRLSVNMPTPPYTSYKLRYRSPKSNLPDERVIRLIPPTPPLRENPD